MTSIFLRSLSLYAALDLLIRMNCNMIIIMFLFQNKLFKLLTMANNNNSDDDDQISDDDLGSFIFGDLNEDTLRIQAETLDDLFTGVSSKRRFTRQEGEEHKNGKTKIFGMVQSEGFSKGKVQMGRYFFAAYWPFDSRFFLKKNERYKKSFLAGISQLFMNESKSHLSTFRLLNT